MHKKPPKQDSKSEAIAKLNDLYITTRRKYIMQATDEYRATKDPHAKYAMFDKFPLNDGLLDSHIEGKNTYGVFNASASNKFITFDVDYEDDEKQAKEATMLLVTVLVAHYNIPLDDIHVSISGGKGYHVDLFFDRLIAVDTVQAFYRNVIKDASLPSNKVEFRPTWAQGVKLPLGIHQRTKRRCWFVDGRTLAPIESYDYLNDVQPLNADVIIDGAIELSVEQAAEFAEIERKTDTSVTSVHAVDTMRQAADILGAGRLTASNTRHQTTLKLAKFFNSQGVDSADAIIEIMDVLHNTPRDYFSKGSTPEHWQKETERIVKITYERNYTLGNANLPFTVYKSEILAVLDVGTFRQKQMAYAMLVTSKRYGDVFYLTVNSAMRMLGTNSRSLIQNSFTKLAEVGYMEYVRKGESDKARSRELGRPFSKVNLYRLLIDKPIKGELSVEVTGERTLVDVVYMLCDSKEIRKRVKRHEFSNQWVQQSS